jgi:hypothetical protein
VIVSSSAALVTAAEDYGCRIGARHADPRG